MPPPGTPLMITSQHPLRIVIQTPKNDLGTTVVERHGRCGSQATRLPALPLPVTVPVGYGPCAESPASGLLWRLAASVADLDR